MFLRNQFKSVGMFKLPLVKKQEISLEDVSLIGYDKVNQSNDYKGTKWGDEINYFGEEAPKFKYFKITGVNKMNNDYVNNDYDGDYKSKEEFYDSVERHSEIVFEWKDKSYEICSMDGKRWWFFNVTDDTQVIVNTIEELMNCEIDGEKLVDICTKFTVIERTF